MKEMKVRVTTTGGGSKSIHLFETNKEANDFISWLLQYNSDLVITSEDIDNEIDSVSECCTFI